MHSSSSGVARCALKCRGVQIRSGWVKLAIVGLVNKVAVRYHNASAFLKRFRKYKS